MKTLYMDSESPNTDIKCRILCDYFNQIFPVTFEFANGAIENMLYASDFIPKDELIDLMKRFSDDFSSVFSKELYDHMVHIEELLQAGNVVNIQA